MNRMIWRVKIINSSIEPDASIVKSGGLQPIDESQLLEIKEMLNSLNGMEELKHLVKHMEQRVRYIHENQQETSFIENLYTPLVFTGNAGTGKTTAARIIGKLYHALGLFHKLEIKETYLSDISSDYIGKSAENMRRIISEARGGVLFIDEAHQLGDKGSMVAKEAVQELVSSLLNSRNKLVIILAGYDEKMNYLYEMDPGLSCRLPMRIHFNDISPEE